MDRERMGRMGRGPVASQRSASAPRSRRAACAPRGRAPHVRACRMGATSAVRPTDVRAFCPCRLGGTAHAGRRLVTARRGASHGPASHLPYYLP